MFNGCSKAKNGDLSVFLQGLDLKTIKRFNCVVVVISASHAEGCGFKSHEAPILEEFAKGICLCNLLRSTQPNDRKP